MNRQRVNPKATLVLAMLMCAVRGKGLRTHRFDYIIANESLWIATLVFLD